MKIKTANKNDQYNSEDQLPAVIHPKQAASFLGVNINSLYNLLKANKIPGAKKVGQKWLIPKKGFLKWLNSDQ